MTRQELERLHEFYQTRRANALDNAGRWEAWAVELIVQQYDILIAECRCALDAIERETRVPHQLPMF